VPGGAPAHATAGARGAIASVIMPIPARREPGRTGLSLKEQADWAAAAAAMRQRKVRTPQGSVPDNIRDLSVKAQGRRVPQKRNRPRLARGQGKGEKVR